jgi:preprotein translocase subunit SecG
MGMLTVLFIVACVFLVLTVLIQKPQGGGLAGAFGGGAGGSGQTAFGTKTGDALTVLTIIVFCIFLLFAIVLNLGVKAAKSGLAGGLAASRRRGPSPPAVPLRSQLGADHRCPRIAGVQPASETTVPRRQPLPPVTERLRRNCTPPRRAREPSHSPGDDPTDTPTTPPGR